MTPDIRACVVAITVTCVAILAFLGLGLQTASAVEYTFKEDFHYGNEVNAIAVDSSSSPSKGDVYVVGYQLGALKFDAKHKLLGTLPTKSINVFGVTVDQSSGDVYVADLEGGTVEKFDATGTLQSTCTVNQEPSAVAVNETTHNIYVMLAKTHVIDVLTSSCEPLFEITGTMTESFGAAMFGGVAIDESTGDLYVGDSSKETIDKFTSTGVFEFQYGGKGTTASASPPFSTDPVKLDVSVDQPTGNVYVVDTKHRAVDEFTSAGVYLNRVEGAETKAGTFDAPRAAAVAQPSGDLYVGDGSESNEKPEHEVVDVFRVERPHDVVTGSATNIGPTSATLTGTVNPAGKQPTLCQFEYGPDKEPYTATVPCAQSNGQIGSGEAPIPVSANISGLSSGTAYHFRLVTNAEQGGESKFVTPTPVTVSEVTASDVSATSATLSGRVNPGGGVASYRFEYGTDTSYGTSVPLPDGNAGSGTSDVLVAAHPQNLAPATVYHFRLVATNAAGTAESPDHIFKTQTVPGAFSLPDKREWELVSPANKNGALILTSGQGGGGGAALQAATAGNAISYSALGTLGENASGNAEISQVLSAHGSGGWSSQNISTPHGSAKGGTFVPEYHFFSPDLSTAVVIPLDEPPLVPGGARNSVYLRDNANGSYQLLDSLEGERSEGEWLEAMAAWHTGELTSFGEYYRQTFEPGGPRCDPATAPTGGDTVMGTSVNGCAVYFVTPEQKMFVAREAGSGWTTTLIATVSPQDERDWEIGHPEEQGTASRTSANGRYFAFMSSQSLTGYENQDAVSGAKDEEVFLYDANTERLVCVSCNPTGERPRGIVVPEKGEGFTPNPGPLVDYQRAWEDHWLAGSLTSARNTRGFPGFYEPRNLSDSGRLFFDSPEPLAPQDTNGKEDVYEYEPEGVGSCTATSITFQESMAGCVSLISSGLSSSESVFFDASLDGNDVFFFTQGRLVTDDFDTAFDVYDAHVCGGSCSPEDATPPPCDNSDSCKEPPSPQPPVFGEPPSATFSGEGNVVPQLPHRVAKRLNAKQKLARALNACRHRRGRSRLKCEAQARRRYGAHKARKNMAGGGK